jgi:anaerobic ribonucleoside-triphosphate reductase
MDKKMLDAIVEVAGSNYARENANINPSTPAGMMMKFASAAAKEYTHDYLLSDEARTAVDDNLIHIHDMDYYPTKSTTCIQHPLDKILAGGFQASDGTARPCKRIETAGALAAIAMQTVQNEQHGGQAIPAFDFYLAPYVRSTFIEELKKVDDFGEAVAGARELDDEVLNDCLMYVAEAGYNYIDKPDGGCEVAINNTIKRVHQAMEAFIHNMNTMRSRGGGQTVFSSINYGTDTSAEGRCIIREILNSTYEGVGNGQTAIFPIQIFKLKSGINAEPGDPNYDLYELATKVTAKRFFPNYLNLDAPFNQNDLWKPDNPERYKYEVATMGCRTRVFEDRFGEKTSIGRGNLSFTTVNLPRIAMESKNYAEFLEKLEETVDIAVRQLVARYEFQKTALKEQFPMLMSGMWMGSEDLPEATTPVGDVLKHGTLSVGFIGLAEALIFLFGAHHGESERSQKYGLEIVKEMSDRCKYWANKYDLNIALIATPAEGLSGKFVKRDREDFGIIPRVTDKDYYTNSNHVPVDYKISFEDKLRIEAPYHALTPAGHIAYLEMDGNPENNVEAVRQMVDLMRNYNVGYGSINFARARCLDCGYEDGSSKFDVCPHCGSHHVDVIERITGYLVGTVSRWNDGKKDELRHRVSHTSGNNIIQGEID